MLSEHNIAHHLTRMATRQPWQPAVFCPAGRRRSGKDAWVHYSYQQLDEESDLLARGLLSSGILKGKHVALMVRPSLEFFALTFALFKAGTIPVMIDPGIGIRNLKKCLTEARPTTFIGIPRAQIARLLFGWRRGQLEHVITVGGQGFPGSGTLLRDIRRRGEENRTIALPPTKPGDTAAILFTSGSTGVPKGAVYTQENFADQVNALRDTYRIAPGEVDLCTFPLFALFAPALGMTAVVPDMDFTRPARVMPDRIFSAIRDFGVTNMFGSPALLRRVARKGVEDGVQLPSLRRVISAGAPVPPETLEEMSRLLPNDTLIHTPYGATEALPVCTIDSREILTETAESTRQGQGICVGRPVPGVDIHVIRITDDPITTWSRALQLPRGQIGELVVTGPRVTASYFNRPISNKMAKIHNPITGAIMHRMGDLGYQDDKGRFWFCGRKTHRVRRKQQDLYTIPVEAIFNNHQAVYRSALVGVPLPSGTEPVLCVETEEKTDNTTREKIRRELLAAGAATEFTRPVQTILFRKSLPVDIRHNSKIFREKLIPWAAREMNQ